MKRFSLALIAAFALAACGQQPAGEPVVVTKLDGSDVAQQGVPDEIIEPAPVEVVSACRETVFEGIALTHCIADPKQHRITTALSPSTGENSGTMAAFAGGIDGNTIAFVMNGGMYGDDLKAIGYFVQDGNRLSELNRADGPGNFHMKPNGVFFGSGENWRVLPTEQFFSTVRDRPQFGTQSGPMLVVDGELHPEFQDDGPSRAIRNGVGVTQDGKAHFVISNAPISFGQFARFFRDELQTPNALFLDGNVSALWDPATGRMDSGRVGPLIVVEKR